MKQKKLIRKQKKQDAAYAIFERKVFEGIDNNPEYTINSVLNLTMSYFNYCERWINRFEEENPEYFI